MLFHCPLNYSKLIFLFLSFLVVLPTNFFEPLMSKKSSVSWNNKPISSPSLPNSFFFIFLLLLATIAVD